MDDPRQVEVKLSDKTESQVKEAQITQQLKSQDQANKQKMEKMLEDLSSKRINTKYYLDKDVDQQQQNFKKRLEERKARREAGESPMKSKTLSSCVASVITQSNHTMATAAVESRPTMEDMADQQNLDV